MNTNYPTDVPKLLTRAIASRFPVHSHTSVHHARLSPESPRGTRLMYSANWPALIVSQNRARRCGVSDAREWTPRRRKLHVTGRAETRLFSWKVCCRFAQPVTLTRLTPLHPFPSFPRDVDGPHRYHLQTPIYDFLLDHDDERMSSLILSSSRTHEREIKWYKSDLLHLENLTRVQATCFPNENGFFLQKRPLAWEYSAYINIF